MHKKTRYILTKFSVTDVRNRITLLAQLALTDMMLILLLIIGIRIALEEGHRKLYFMRIRSQCILLSFLWRDFFLGGKYIYIVWSGQAELIIESCVNSSDNFISLSKLFNANSLGIFVSLKDCFQSLYVDSCLAAIHPKLLGWFFDSWMVSFHLMMNDGEILVRIFN